MLEVIRLGYERAVKMRALLFGLLRDDRPPVNPGVLREPCVNQGFVRLSASYAIRQSPHDHQHFSYGISKYVSVGCHKIYSN